MIQNDVIPKQDLQLIAKQLGRTLLLNGIRARAEYMSQYEEEMGDKRLGWWQS